ncbi:hypothetical protein ACFE04_004320 [Oxalis oulophora]
MRRKVIVGREWAQVAGNKQLVTSGMDVTSTDSSNNCKILHLIRHAQGIHNVQGQNDRNALLSHKLLDAQLSPLGLQQIDLLRKHVYGSGLLNKIELVITSPMTRTMQTTMGVFGQKVIEEPSKTHENNGHHKLSTSNCLPIVAVELCRERLGVNPCDQRRNISDYRSIFPQIDFSLIENDEDSLWKAEIREAKQDVAARGVKFLKWLWTRPEKEIAVVSHGIFLQQTLTALENHSPSDPSLQSELYKRFDNCEMRTVAIVDRCFEAGSECDSLPGKL